MESSITAKGRVTIPKAVRERLGLKAGDRIKFFFHPDGSVVLLPKIPTSALRGIVKRTRQAVTVAEMNDVIGSGATRAGKRGDRA
jgi:AbrB family looped-hinge helix DNA binding protein